MAATFASNYSGATLFALLLDRHPSISSDGEIFPFQRGSRGLCACGKLQVDCEYYKTVAKHMLRNSETQWNADLFTSHPQYVRLQQLQRALTSGWSLGARFNKLRAQLYLPSMRSADSSFIDAHLEFMSNSLTFSDTIVYVDGTKDWRRAELFATAERINMKAIHLVRDGRGFCNSYIKNKKLGKKGLSKAAKAWVRHVHECDVFRELFPGIPFMTVRYEDICHAYTETINKVCAFLGIPSDVELLNNADRSSHVIGNRMRMKFQGSIQEDRSWEEMLTNDEIRRITDQMRDALRRFNYID